MLVFYVVALFASAFGSQPEVTTPNGVIRGYYTKSYYGNEFAAFEGIPYARPPIGKNRFSEPKPPKPWLGAWEATKLHTCLQYFHYNLGTDKDMVIGDEDCLYVNVYMPKVSKSEPLDVIVYIHGGAFMFGSGGSYGPYILMERNVVYVTINYRLGPLGFLSTEDKVLPGNLGMKDQVFALKWIKDNIEHFGGNPNSITITGLSAGGASVHLHLLSPLSKGLFTNAISQSGHALDAWVLVEGALEKTKFIASTLGCPTSSNQDMVHCLRYRPARQIVDRVKLLQHWLYNPFSPLGVVIDADAVEPFLPEHPYTLLEKKKVNDVPWVLSHTNSEGLYPASDFLGDPKHLPDLEKNWNKYLPYILHYDATMCPKQHDIVSQKIKDYYLKGKTVSEETYPEVIQMIGDRLFVTDSEIVAKMHSAATKSAVYYYYYKYRGAHSLSELMTINNNDYGASHGDDTTTLLSTRIDSLSTPKDREMSKIMVDMWLAFAKNGVPRVPNVDWKPISKNAKDLLQYLEITAPNDIKMTSAEHFNHHDFWESLKFNENRNLLYPVKDEL